MPATVTHLFALRERDGMSVARVTTTTPVFAEDSPLRNCSVTVLSGWSYDLPENQDMRLCMPTEDLVRKHVERVEWESGRVAEVWVGMQGGNIFDAGSTLVLRPRKDELLYIKIEPFSRTSFVLSEELAEYHSVMDARGDPQPVGFTKSLAVDLAASYLALPLSAYRSACRSQRVPHADGAHLVTSAAIPSKVVDCMEGVDCRRYFGSTRNASAVPFLLRRSLECDFTPHLGPWRIVATNPFDPSFGVVLATFSLGTAAREIRAAVEAWTVKDVGFLRFDFERETVTDMHTRKSVQMDKHTRLHLC